MTRSLARNNPQRPTEGGQALGTIFCHHYIIFNANAAPSLQIDTGLDREDHALFKRHVVALDNSRLFVDIQA
jgi:hypothetical protein